MPHAIAVSADETPTARDRIQRLSKPFIWVFGGLTALIVTFYAIVFLASFVIDAPNVRITNEVLEVGQGEIMILPEVTAAHLQNTTAMADVPLKTRLVFTLNGLLLFGSLAAVFYHSCQLFRLYEQGSVFAPENAARMRDVALWLILWGLAPTISHQIASAFGVVDSGWLRPSSFAAIVFGGFLFVLAKVTDLGRDMERERAEYI